MSSLPRFSHSADDRYFDAIAGALKGNGYAVVPDALPAGLADALFIHFKNLDASEFSRAGIGKQDGYQINNFVRGDAIAWLDNGCAASEDYLAWMDRLRLELNRRLFLGLFDFECHYAWYPQGAFYKKHHDAFKGKTTRIISTVYYINPAWAPGDGGELVLYSPHDEQLELERITPQYGKLVLFLSEDFPHEVLPVNKPRYSIAGWFRINNSINHAIDPPC